MKVFSIVHRYDPSITSVTIECRDNTSLSAVVATIVLNLIWLYQECFHLIVFYIHAKVVGRAITDINKQCNLLSTVMSGSYRPQLLQFLWICITLDAQFIFNCFVHRMKSNRFFLHKVDSWWNLNWLEEKGTYSTRPFKSYIYVSLCITAYSRL